MMSKPAGSISTSVLITLLGLLLSGCATKKPPPAPPVVASPPTPTSTTTCFLLQVYNPATRQYEKQKICSETSEKLR